MISSLLPLLCTVEILSFHFYLVLRGHRGENACIIMLYGTEKKYVSQKWSIKHWFEMWIKKNPREIALRGGLTRDSIFQNPSVAKIRCQTKAKLA